MKEEIKINGNFAVRVGNMWAKRDYEGAKLTEQPDSLMKFADAYKLAKKIGGKVHMFKPKEIPEAEIESLILAAGIKESEDED